MKRDWLPLPYPELMIQVMQQLGGLEPFLEVITKGFTEGGEATLAALKESDIVRPNDRVLDLAAGCGRLARVLVDEPIASYVGFDRDEAMIAWCASVFPERDPRFSFRVLKPVFEQAGDGRFHLRAPFEDDAFDLVLAETTFDNLPLEHADAYLRELGRVVAPGGRVVASAYFAVGRTYADPAHHYYAPKPFWSFVEEAGFDHRLREMSKTGAVRNWMLLTSRKAAR
jgi:ubiquinone/menaquinone biosynthesis C-methylase UbiE